MLKHTKPPAWGFKSSKTASKMLSTDMKWTGPESQTWRIELVRPEADLMHWIKLQWLFRFRLPATVSRWWGVRHWERLVIVQWCGCSTYLCSQKQKNTGKKKQKNTKRGGGPRFQKVIHSFQPSWPALMGLGRTRRCSVCRKYRGKEHVMDQFNRCNKSSLLREVVNLCAYDVH